MLKRKHINIFHLISNPYFEKAKLKSQEDMEEELTGISEVTVSLDLEDRTAKIWHNERTKKAPER